LIYRRLGRLPFGLGDDVLMTWALALLARSASVKVAASGLSTALTNSFRQEPTNSGMRAASAGAAGSNGWAGTTAPSSVGDQLRPAARAAVTSADAGTVWSLSRLFLLMFRWASAVAASLAVTSGVAVRRADPLITPAR
jgi:hypothetical protein